MLGSARKRLAVTLAGWLSIAGGAACGSDAGDPAAGAGGASSGSSGTGGAGSSAGGSGTGGSTGSNGGNSGSGGSTGGTAAATGGTSSGTGGTGGGGGEGECSADSPITCTSEAEMSLCIDGEYEELTCVEACELIAFSPGRGCSEPSGCNCGEPLDDECAKGVVAACTCADCVQSDAVGYYVECATNVDPQEAEIIRCFAAYVDVEAETVDCGAAVEVCLPEE